MNINEDLLPTTYRILYDSPTGTKSAVTLADSAANYDYLDIAFKSTDGDYYSKAIRVYNPNNRLFRYERAEGFYNSNTDRFDAYTVEKEYKIQDKSISISVPATIYNIRTGSGSYYDNISIIKVVGYKLIR